MKKIPKTEFVRCKCGSIFKCESVNGKEYCVMCGEKWRGKMILKKISMGIFLAIIIFWAMVTSLNCISAPDPEDYQFKDCYDTAYCRYLNARSSKNSVDCSKDADYCNKIRCMVNCNNDKIKGKLDFSQCWDKLR